MDKIRIAISVGELSGEEHAAELIRCVIALKPQVSFCGMGGGLLQKLGVQIFVDSRKNAGIMGFEAVARSFLKIRRDFATMSKMLESEKPQALVVIDYPDFNMRLAKVAKKLNIPVFYFIPPKVWAWREKRVTKIKDFVDCAALIYPFERAFYEKHGYQKSVYVGHPFCGHSQLKPASSEEKFQLKHELGLDSARPTLAIFPGSRWGEIRSHLHPMLEALKLVKEKHPDLQAIISIAATISKEKMAQEFPGLEKLALCSPRPIEIMRAADIGLLKSGTSNLQAAFCGLPHVMFHKISALAAIIVRRLIKVSEYSPVNVNRSGTTKELVQEDATAQKAAVAIEELLSSSHERERVSRGLSEVVRMLSDYDKREIFQGSQSAYDRTARLLLRFANS